MRISFQVIADSCDFRHRLLLNMFYFFRANPLPQPKIQERPSPRTRKLLLVLLLVFHALFFGFNVYYFMFNSKDSYENEADSGLEEVSNEAVGVEPQI